MSKKKIIIILIVLVALISIALGIYLLFFSSAPKENKSKKQKDSQTTIIIRDKLFSQNTTKETLIKYFGSEPSSDIIAIGKDSLIAMKPKKDITNKYNLDEYINKREKYINNYNKNIIKELKFTITKETTEFVEISYKTWDYYAYICDLLSVSSLIMSKENIDLNMLEEDFEKYTAYEYEATTMALMILDSHLSDYNVSSKKEVQVEKFDGKVDYNQIYELLIQYDNSKINVDENKINSYYEEGIKNKTIVPLKLTTN